MYIYTAVKIKYFFESVPTHNNHTPTIINFLLSFFDNDPTFS